MSSLPTLPGFRVLGRIGAGGMGEVFRAVRVGPGGFRKPVALKRLAVAHSLDARHVQRFFREARILARLEHPNIVEVHDLLALEAGYFLVMELLRGPTWLELDVHGERPWWVHLAVADQVLAGLAYAHAVRDEAGRAVGLVHRDLTPRNVLVGTSGAVKVLDFGLARVIEGLTGRLTGEGQLAGTLEYLSPEQARGEEVDARSDIHQLGACLHRALTGDAPHGGGSPSELLARAMTGAVRPIGERRPDLPAPVRDLIDRALAGPREARFEDAGRMRAAVRAALAHAPTPGDDAIAAALADLAAAGGWPAWEPGDEPRDDDGDDGDHAAAATAEIDGDPQGAARAAEVRGGAAAPRLEASAGPPRARAVRRIALGAAAAALLAATAATAFSIGRASPEELEPATAAAAATAPRWQRLSFRRGLIDQARFAGDGPSFALAARWGDGAADVYLGAAGDPVPRPRGLDGAALLAVSPGRELALLVDGAPAGRFARRGVLARAPLQAGPITRTELADVIWADAGPGGRLALVRSTGAGARLESPPGTVLLREERGWLGPPRFSPAGDSIAVARHPSPSSERGWIERVDLAGAARRLGPEWARVTSVAWRPDGGEVWMSAADAGDLELRAVRAAGGPARVLAGAPGDVVLEDVAPDGSALVRRDEADLVVWAGRWNAPPRDLSWQDRSTVHDVSRDGHTLLLGEELAAGAAEGGRPRVLVRRTDGSPAVAIADGYPAGLVSDGTRALVIAADRGSIALVSTGGGPLQSVPTGDLGPIAAASISPDGDLVLVGVKRDGEPGQVHAIDPESGARRPVGRPGLELPPVGGSIASDSKQAALVDVPTGLLVLVSLDGGADGSSAPGEVRPAPGAQPGELFARFRTRQTLYVARLGGARVDLGRIDLGTRTRELWRTIAPPDPSGLVEITSFALATVSDGWALTGRRRLSTLYLVQGL